MPKMKPDNTLRIALEVAKRENANRTSDATQKMRSLLKRNHAVCGESPVIAPNA